MDNSDKLIKGVILSAVAILVVGFVIGLAIFGVLWLILR